MLEYMEDPTQYFTVLEERIGDTQQCTGGEVVVLHYGLEGCNFVLLVVPGAMEITEIVNETGSYCRQSVKQRVVITLSLELGVALPQLYASVIS